jgi:hypothetical protein
LQDLNLLLESIENAGTPKQQRFIRASQTSIHPPLPAGSAHPGMTSSSSSVPMDTEFVTANANFTAMKVENMLPGASEGLLSKLEQEYEVIASSLENPQLFSSQFDPPAPLFTTRSGDAIPVAQPQEQQSGGGGGGGGYSGMPELSFAHKQGCTMMDVTGIDL